LQSNKGRPPNERRGKALNRADFNKEESESTMERIQLSLENTMARDFNYNKHEKEIEDYLAGQYTIKLT